MKWQNRTNFLLFSIFMIFFNEMKINYVYNSLFQEKKISKICSYIVWYPLISKDIYIYVCNLTQRKKHKKTYISWFELRIDHEHTDSKEKFKIIYKSLIWKWEKWTNLINSRGMIRCSSLSSHDEKLKLMSDDLSSCEGNYDQEEKQIKKVSNERNNLVGNNSRKRRKAS